ncbi:MULTISPECIES: TonB-dependent siderophore receptor [Chryseobacterium]|uniref:TonB-dependent receptor plug domain-containing protein n=1 Tax=Chryseobacterium TaxID=59732 RepID=UPI00162A74CC|nr:MULTISPECIES: TonB-dependent receptor [Chryseobacterium]MDM1554909.1 TonB-dependent receptor [Chryseobacterium indologenes]
MKKYFFLLTMMNTAAYYAQTDSTSTKTRDIEGITVTASRRAQKITEVPATVNIINAKDIQEFTSFNVGELAARQKGVDFVRSGVLGTGINIRGFNSAFNSKNLQLTDDRVQTLVATGLPFGTFSTVIKEDIEKVEILLGPNGTLYGPNAHNGLVNTITKNPFRSQGTTLTFGAGNQNVLTTRVRHAQALSKSMAFKVALEHTQGTEFNYVDSVYVNNKAYPELDLNRDFTSTKFNGQLNYRLPGKSELVAYYGHSNNNNLAVTSAGRNQIKDWNIDELQLKYIHPRFFLNTYYTWSNTDKTYAINQRTQNYVSMINAGFSDADARERSYTQQWFPVPALPSGGIFLNRGALFKDNSKRFNAEGQYNNTWGAFSVIGGVQFQRDMAYTRNTYMLDFDGPINVNQLGVYGQAEYKVDGWGFLGALRLDKHDYYGSNLLPKAAITKKVGDGHFRLTYGKGMAVPSIMNLKGYLFGGLVLGNGEGFTLSDGSQIASLQVETINSFEVGYKGNLGKKFWLDANAYYNMSENFIGPLLNIATGGRTVTKMESTPLSDIPGANPAMVLTYSNFGKVKTYGFDIGLNYYWTDHLKTVINYSYFGRDIDKNDLANDGDHNGKVTDTDIPINTPANKFSLGLNYTTPKFFGAIYGRYVQKYDFFSGINIAAKTQDLDGDGINDIFENARNGRTWNYGQLGGFTVDLNGGYNFNNGISIGANVTNLFNAKVREFVASPVIGTLVSVEFKYNIDFFKKNN